MLVVVFQSEQLSASEIGYQIACTRIHHPRTQVRCVKCDSQALLTLPKRLLDVFLVRHVPEGAGEERGAARISCSLEQRLSSRVDPAFYAGRRVRAIHDGVGVYRISRIDRARNGVPHVLPVVGVDAVDEVGDDVRSRILHPEHRASGTVDFESVHRRHHHPFSEIGPAERDTQPLLTFMQCLSRHDAFVHVLNRADELNSNPLAVALLEQHPGVDFHPPLFAAAAPQSIRLVVVVRKVGIRSAANSILRFCALVRVNAFDDVAHAAWSRLGDLEQVQRPFIEQQFVRDQINHPDAHTGHFDGDPSLFVAQARRQIVLQDPRLLEDGAIEIQQGGRRRVGRARLRQIGTAVETA